MTEIVSLETILAEMNKRCSVVGGAAQLAREAGISNVAVLCARTGRNKPGEAILSALGFQTVYIRKVPLPVEVVQPVVQARRPKGWDHGFQIGRQG